MTLSRLISVSQVLHQRRGWWGRIQKALSCFTSGFISNPRTRVLPGLWHARGSPCYSFCCSDFFIHVQNMIHVCTWICVCQHIHGCVCLFISLCEFLCVFLCLNLSAHWAAGCGSDCCDSGLCVWQRPQPWINWHTHTFSLFTHTRPWIY